MASVIRRRIGRGLAFLLVAFILLIIGAVAAFNLNAFNVKGQMIQQAIRAMPQPAVPVTTVTARKDAWPLRIAAIGTFDAVRGVTVSSQVAGRVSEILFESGALVKEGDVLVKLDTSVEVADLAEANAQLKLANLTLTRTEELAGRGNAAQSSLDKARADRDAAQARVERIQANIALKTITAPFNGRLGIRQANLGQYLAPGTAIVTLQSIDPIFVNFTVPERELARLAVGQRLTVRVDGLVDERFEGSLTTIDARIDQNTRNIAIQGTVPNGKGALVPGMFAEVRVRLGEDREYVTVPQTAVSYSLYGDSVFVVVPAKTKEGAVMNGPDGKPLLTIERRFVRVGEKREADAAILEGIAAGETVVTSGQTRLLPNVRVVIDNSINVNPPAERQKP